MFLCDWKGSSSGRAAAERESSSDCSCTRLEHVLCPLQLLMFFAVSDLSAFHRTTFDHNISCIVLQSTEGSALRSTLLAISADFKERLCDLSGRTFPLLPLPASLLQGVSLFGSQRHWPCKRQTKNCWVFCSKATSCWPVQLLSLFNYAAV